MRPRSSVQAVLLFNEQDGDGNWVPRKYELGSWVTLRPAKRGGHGKDRSSAEGDYKAKILQFRMSAQSVSEVRVQHAYQYRQLDLNPEVPISMFGANCKFRHPALVFFPKKFRSKFLDSFALKLPTWIDAHSSDLLSSFQFLMFSICHSELKCQSGGLP